VVTTPALARILEELIIEVEVAIPLTVDVSVLTAPVRSFVLTKLAVVVAVLPLTIEVRTNELVEVEIVNVFDVEDATRLVRSVEVATPLTVVVSVVPVVLMSFAVMTVVVAVTPLITVVKILPVVDCVNELIREASVPDTPFTIVWNTLADEEATLLVMMVEVADDPPMFEVRILPVAESVFEAVRLVTVKFVKNPVLPLSVVMVEEAEVKSVIVAEEIVVVANEDVPVAVTVVNVGVLDTLMVEVPVSVMLLPAVRLATGVVTRVFHCVVEAVSGIE
jgi:hypothetical protein